MTIPSRFLGTSGTPAVKSNGYTCWFAHPKPAAGLIRCWRSQPSSNSKLAFTGLADREFAAERPAVPNLRLRSATAPKPTIALPVRARRHDARIACAQRDGADARAAWSPARQSTRSTMGPDERDIVEGRSTRGDGSKCSADGRNEGPTAAGDKVALVIARHRNVTSRHPEIARRPARARQAARRTRSSYADPITCLRT